jgi:hypothetical protein
MYEKVSRKLGVRGSPFFYAWGWGRVCVCVCVCRVGQRPGKRKPKSTFRLCTCCFLFSDGPLGVHYAQGKLASLSATAQTSRGTCGLSIQQQAAHCLRSRRKAD